MIKVKTAMRLASCLLVFTAAFSGAADAQQPKKQQPQKAPAASSTPAAPDAAAPAPQAAIRTEIKVIDLWEITCAYGKDDKKIGCSAVLKVRQDKTNRIIFLWKINSDANGLTSVFESQTGVFISPGVQFKIDGGQPRGVPFVSCAPTACAAAQKMDDAFVQAASGAQAVEAAVVALDGKTYTFGFAPTGIAKVIPLLRQ